MTVTHAYTWMHIPLHMCPHTALHMCQHACTSLCTLVHTHCSTHMPPTPVCTHVHTHAYSFVHVSTYTSLHTCPHMCTNNPLHMFPHIGTQSHIAVHTCPHTHISLHTCPHIHIALETGIDEAIFTNKVLWFHNVDKPTQQPPGEWISPLLPTAVSHAACVAHQHRGLAGDYVSVGQWGPRLRSPQVPVSPMCLQPHSPCIFSSLPR